MVSKIFSLTILDTLSLFSVQVLILIAEYITDLYYLFTKRQQNQPK